MFSIIMAKESFLLQGNFFKHKILIQLLQMCLEMFPNQRISLFPIYNMILKQIFHIRLLFLEASIVVLKRKKLLSLG